MAPASEGLGAGAFACTVCGAGYPSRNGLFRHLRESASCAEVGGYAAAPASCTPAKPREPAPADPKKPCDEKPQPVPLRLETRPESYELELQAKVQRMRGRFAGLQEPGEPELDVEVFASPREHYRMRVEFDVWKDDRGVNFIMFDGKERVPVQRYPMGARIICDTLMPSVLDALRREEALKHRVWQATFHATLHGDALVSLLYHSPFHRLGGRRNGRGDKQQAEQAPLGEGLFGPDWEAAARRLQQAVGGASIVGHSHGQKCVVGRDWVEERLQVAGVAAPLRYRQLEGFFSQPNAEVAQHMLSWARAVARADDAAVGSSGPARDDDLLELYCGNGNFAVALAPCFRRVLATELVRALLGAAQQNAADNGAENVTVARVSAEDLAAALDGVRPFQRLAHVDLSSFILQTVLVDPPRAGLGPVVSRFLTRYPRIVYISCSPETARADLEILRETHVVRRLAAFDQFPYTEHLEMGMLLTRRHAQCAT